MNIPDGWEALRAAPGPLYLAIGLFDGVHRGHAAVIGEAVRRAQAQRGSAWVLTFDPHPERVLTPDQAPPAIAPIAARVRWIRALGAHGCVVIHFDRAFAAQTPEAFAALLQTSAPALRAVVVGRDWRFGRGAQGDAARLAALGRRHGFDVIAVAPVLHGDQPVSSTRIRRAVAEGRLDEAAAMLGRPFTLFGPVVRGRQIGHQLGYPTANLLVENELLPPDGIYAARLRHPDGRLLAAAAYRGRRPTFGDPAERVVEAHLLDVTVNLYGERVELELWHRIREDRRFDSTEALRQQIADDIGAIRAWLQAAIANSGV